MSALRFCTPPSQPLSLLTYEDTVSSPVLHSLIAQNEAKGSVERECNLLSTELMEKDDMVCEVGLFISKKSINHSSLQSLINLKMVKLISFKRISNYVSLSKNNIHNIFNVHSKMYIWKFTKFDASNIDPK